MKIALGTAQFGLDYGISNVRGIIPQSEVFEILETARKYGIDLLDTARSYGSSEQLIGRYLKSHPGAFGIVTKVTADNPDKIDAMVQDSLRSLGVDSIYGCLVHDFKSYRANPEIWNTLLKQKHEGRVRKIGFSFYFPREVEELLDKGITPDLIQVPFNIFDRRFAVIIQRLHERGVEVHVRSVFLQGLLLMAPEELTPPFNAAGPALRELINISGESGIPSYAMCLNFVAINESVDRIVIGVASEADLRENLNALQYLDRTLEILDRLNKVSVDDESIILPINWPEERA